jgi:flagellar biosynthetic protein FliO
VRNKTIKILFANMYVFIIAAVCVAGPTDSPSNTGIGNFDIEKVRRAVTEVNGSTKTDTALSTVSAKQEKVNAGWLIAKICFYLALIIGAIFLLTWAIKRLGLAGRSKIRGGSMDILETLPLGQNRNIMLVRVTDRVYLLSQTPAAISVLDTLTGESALELISSTKGGVSVAQFKDVFNSFMGKMKKPG